MLHILVGGQSVFAVVGISAVANSKGGKRALDSFHLSANGIKWTLASMAERGIGGA
jgi:hypothetical protein